METQTEEIITLPMIIISSAANMDEDLTSQLFYSIIAMF